MKRVGYVYDEAMEKHEHADNKKHPECPDRIRIPYAMLQKSGVLDKCVQVKSRIARDQELKLVHEKNHIQAVKMYSASQKTDVCKLAEQWKTYISDATYTASATATGCLLSLMDDMYGEKQLDSGVAIIRPPGHHAEIDLSSGFCFFNHVAVATKYVQREHNVDKVLIVDWDIHHGNGIQHVFYDDPSVMYISLHRYDNADYFPQLKEGNYDYTGSGEGVGYNVNIPWNKDMMSNSEYKAAFERIVIPIAKQFCPELILVAAGFDAAAADLLGEYVLTPPMYGYMTKELITALPCKIALSLEGGYNCNAVGESLTSCIQALLGEEIQEKMEFTEPCKRAQQTITAVIKEQSKFWKLE